MYRPLPNGITITKSGIDGLGVVATKTFKVDIVLGIAHIANKNFPHGYIRTALGAFYNHSDDPNCIVLNGYWHQIPVKYLVTSQNIKVGDELTAKYTLYTVEDFLWE